MSYKEMEIEILNIFEKRKDKHKETMLNASLSMSLF